MKHLSAFVAALVLGGASAFSVHAQAPAAGTLDPSFGTGGKVFTSFAANATDVANAVAQQPDGKLLVAGHGNGSGQQSLQMARYNPNGSLDPSFGTGGLVTASLGSSPPSALYPNGGSTAYATSILVQPGDGRIVVAGRRGYEFLIARFLPNGSLDTSFGTNGLHAYAAANLGNTNLKVVRESSGALLTLGRASGLASFYSMIRRYSPAGVPDAAYGQNGFARIGPFAGNPFSPVNALLDPANRLLVIGSVTTSQSGRLAAVTRLLPTGTIDLSFGNQGLSVCPNPQGSEAEAIERQPDGKLVLGTSTLLWRLDANGTTDLNFGINGTADMGTAALSPRKVLVQADGKILAAGQVRVPNSTNYDFAVSRFTSTGQPDASFANNASLVFSESNADDFTDALLQADGNLVAAGYASAINGGAGPSRFALCRILTRTVLATRPGAGTAVLRAYPNPAHHTLQVELAQLPAGAYPVQLTLSNALGQQVQAQAVTSPASTSLSLTGLAPGVYWLRGQASKAGAPFGQRVVVE